MPQLAESPVLANDDGLVIVAADATYTSGTVCELGPAAGCRDADLQAVSLRDVDLTGADFSDSDLRNGGTLHTDLSGASFAGADLSLFVFSETDLTRADRAATSPEPTSPAPSCWE